VEQLRRIKPPSIEVNSYHVAAVVAVHHPIRVKHWNYLEHKGLPQRLGIFTILKKEEINDPLDHIGGVAFARMDPSCEKHHFLVGVKFLNVLSNS